VAEPLVDYAAVKPVDAAKLIKQLEDRMYAAARSLEFEEAARLRDEIKQIEQRVMKS
jgi:excinuclease ABC subunit B